jgi:hypothetical protein
MAGLIHNRLVDELLDLAPVIDTRWAGMLHHHDDGKFLFGIDPEIRAARSPRWSDVISETVVRLSTRASSSLPPSAAL